MICTELWNGQGLGNMLFSYIATRVRALDLGIEFGIAGKERFKGSSFMDLDFGLPVVGGVVEKEGGKPTNLPMGIFNYFLEKEVRIDGIDVRGLDPEYFFIEDNTWIEGLFQDPKYFEHRLKEIREWLKLKDGVHPTYKDMFTCIIGFRGGEYVGVPDLFLPQSYWDEAIEMMRKIEPRMKFEVHTDDPETAKRFFPDFPIIHNVEKNWLAVRYASYLIISNSSFYILPALLNQVVQKIIAPRYWARRNTGVWALPQNYYKQFTYI